MAATPPPRRGAALLIGVLADKWPISPENIGHLLANMRIDASAVPAAGDRFERNEPPRGQGR
jgi:hypothetical protein